MDGSKRTCTAEEVDAVITSYNQGEMVLEAVRSLCVQTILPTKIIIVDDGSTDKNSLDILNAINEDSAFPVPITVIKQPNSGVSAARNTGIRRTDAPLVLVLDGDDKVRPSYIERVRRMLWEDSSMVAGSTWMNTFGVLDSVICPGGGSVREFLVRNCCPATHIFRREAWEKSGGYDESMRSGFEDWEFFLSMLEILPDAHIGIVAEPLIDYRTASASSNVKSMAKRLELMRFMIKKHNRLYQDNLEEVILGVESISMSRLYGWESEMCSALKENRSLSPESMEFIHSPSYGDGGMAAAVRIASDHKSI